MDKLMTEIFLLAIALGAGYWFCMVWDKRGKISATPTSRIKDIQTGRLTEIVGYAKRTAPLVSPLTQRPCVFYKYTVERYQRSGKHSRFVTIASGDSSYSAFILDDRTSKAAVDPRKAEVVLTKNYEFTNGFGNNIPANLIHFMEQNGINHRGWFGESRMRFREWVIAEDAQIYVLGQAFRNSDFNGQQRNTLDERIRELKDTPDYQKQVDENNDGVIDQAEWDHAVRKIEDQVLEELSKAPVSEMPEVIIGKGQDSFIISDKSQDDLMRYYTWQMAGGALGIAGAIAAALVVFFVKKGA